MLLDRDQFVVTFDPSKATEVQLIVRVKESGYTAQVVTEAKNDKAATALTALPEGFELLDAALSRATRERKAIVLDFFAEWCVPCRRMERTTLTDSRVAALLERVVFIRIDADKQPELAQKLGVVGLPDIRLVAPDGRVLRQLRGYQEAEVFATAIERLVQEVGK